VPKLLIIRLGVSAPSFSPANAGPHRLSVCPQPARPDKLIGACLYRLFCRPLLRWRTPRIDLPANDLLDRNGGAVYLSP
jgi:hypothetical protein